MITFSPIRFDELSLLEYASLFAKCFPKANKFTLQYLRWLYSMNPCGAALGFDAWIGCTLVAHYVCIPVRAMVLGRPSNVLLSLNTATHPSHQGKGLFTRLAEMTYSAGEKEGFCGVYGIANANSTPGFVRKLGFQLVDSLEARIGIGETHVETNGFITHADFSRIWTKSSLDWRCANPNNSVVTRSSERTMRFFAVAIPGLVSAYAELPLTTAIGTSMVMGNNLELNPFHVNLFLGLLPYGCGFKKYYSIPHYFRPSPLNFIYRSLLGNQKKLDKTVVSLSFLDFDAY